MEKTPTIYDVADALGLHKSTVSLALSGKGNVSSATRARVVTAARVMGYEPNPLAQRLAKGHQNTLVCLFGGALDVGLGTEKILLIQKRLNELSLEVPIYVVGDGARDRGELQAEQIRQLCRQRPRAIICASHNVEPTVFPALESYQRSGGILISYDLPIPLDCDQVVFDREDNAYQAARYLLKRGHRSIGIAMSNHAAWSSEYPNVPQVFRLRGFRRALEEFGAPLREEWLFANPSTYEKGGAEMARRFVSLNERPTGLCIVNDYVALAFMTEILRAGLRVPEDVSIVGHDNQPIAGYCPVPLTAISHPVDEIARSVVELVQSRLQGLVSASRTIILKGEFVERSSVSSPAPI